MRTEDVGTEQDFAVSKVITHPLYHKPKGYSHDIALLKLEKPARLGRCVFSSQTVVIFSSPAGLVSQTRYLGQANLY